MVYGLLSCVIIMKLMAVSLIYRKVIQSVWWALGNLIVLNGIRAILVHLPICLLTLLNPIKIFHKQDI